MSAGRVVQVNVSAGGVPKLPVASARITRHGVEGDRQREITVHGGPHRAVSILGLEAIERVAAEGHPIAPGTTGENLTVAGFDVSLQPIGTRLHVGAEVVLELSGRADPCRTIRRSFADGRFGRLSGQGHPADSRMYARVIVEGVVRPDDPIRLEAPVDDRADRYARAGRLDRAERASALAIWESARASGADVAILDDGEVAVAASRSLPSSIFNSALGFAHLPNLSHMAADHFARHGATGWIWAEDPPWPDAVADTEAELLDAPVDAIRLPAAGAGDLTVRELGRDEIGPWGAVIAEAADLPAVVREPWRRLEEPLASVTHHHRFVAERAGRIVGAASLHTHHGVGWLRAATVLPEARGRGVQRAMIAVRAAHARRLGCDRIGSLAEVGSASAGNLRRLGLEPIAVRRRYRVDPAAPDA